MMKRVLIVTEANARVASGHLFECLVCYEELRGHGVSVEIMVNSDLQQGLKEKLPEEYLEYKENIQEESKYLAEIIAEHIFGVVIFNLREIKNEFLQELKKRIRTTCVIILIDEFGNRRLDADIIINPMIDAYYWNYETNGKVYCGAQYLMLSRNLKVYHDKERIIHENLEKITVSMGGVDLPGTTVKLAGWLEKSALGKLQINIVIGAGFMHLDELKIYTKGKENIHIYQNIANIFELFMESDLAICAGGNTLHELAAIGTPTLVIPSMPHEIRNGKAFEKQGFGICCEDAQHITEQLLEQHIEKILGGQSRKKMSVCGKKISDGEGVERVLNIILSEVMLL